MNKLRAALLSLEEPLAARSEGDVPEEPDVPIYRRRGLSYSHTPVEAVTRIVVADPAEAYAATLQKQAEYLNRDNAQATLLLNRIQPGLGKTTQTIQTLEMMAGLGRPSYYLGPRTAQYTGEVYPRIKDKSLVTRWITRQRANPADPSQIETCKWAGSISDWMKRGYEPFEFCKIAPNCGQAFAQNSCVYNQQRNSPELITYGHHNHATLGNPKMRNAAFLAGDEMPLDAFLHPWLIDKPWIFPRGLNVKTPFGKIVKKLSDLAERNLIIEGKELYDILGGAEEVYRAAAEFTYDSNAAYAQAWISDIDEAATVPFHHLEQLHSLMLRETERLVQGLGINPRVVLVQGSLLLLLRKFLHADAVDKPIIWLDGTGQPALYETLFGRPVEVLDVRIQPKGKVYQLWTRANGKSSLYAEPDPEANNLPVDPPVVAEGELPVTKDRLRDLKTLILWVIEKKGYERPGIVTFKKVEEFFHDIPNAVVGHFYAERGSNAFVGCDALFVVGTPLPELRVMQWNARMIYFDRDEPFQKDWSTKPVPYAFVDEQGRTPAYDVSGYWNDGDLQTEVEIYREDELEQAAERSRRAIRHSDVWLLTNIPLRNVAPDSILTEREIFDAPEGADPYMWARVLQLADEYYSSYKSLSANDLRITLNIKSHTTAMKYWDLLAKAQPDRWQIEPALVRKETTGRKPKNLVPK